MVDKLEFLRTNWRYLAIGSAVLLVCGGAFFWFHTQQEARQTQIVASAARQQSIAVSKPAEKKSVASSSDKGYVYIAGAVQHPGLYPIQRQMRWADVVQSAGGLAKDADVSNVNLAKIAKDQENLTVPVRGASNAAAVSSTGTVATTTSGGTTAASSGSLIDLNAATLTQLQTISGVGPKRAQDILDYRDAHGGFKKVDELKEISGIGDKIFADIQPKVTVGP